MTLDKLKISISYGLYLLSVATLALLIGGSERTFADTEVEIETEVATSSNATPSNAIMRAVEGDIGTEEIGIAFRIPSTVSLARDDEYGGYTGEYEIEVTALGDGDILIIEPDEKLELRQENKNSVITAYVEQRDTEFEYTGTAHGEVRIFKDERLSAGTWTGSFSFYITTVRGTREDELEICDLESLEETDDLDLEDILEKSDLEDLDETEIAEEQGTAENDEILGEKAESLSEDDSGEAESLEPEHEQEQESENYNDEQDQDLDSGETSEVTDNVEDSSENGVIVEVTDDSELEQETEGLNETESEQGASVPEEIESEQESEITEETEGLDEVELEQESEIVEEIESEQDMQEVIEVEQYTEGLDEV